MENYFNVLQVDARVISYLYMRFQEKHVYLKSENFSNKPDEAVIVSINVFLNKFSQELVVTVT